MAKYYFTNKAVEDLSDIWEYTAEAWSQKQADKYYEAGVPAELRKELKGAEVELITDGKPLEDAQRHSAAEARKKSFERLQTLPALGSKQRIRPPGPTSPPAPTSRPGPAPLQDRAGPSAIGSVSLATESAPGPRMIRKIVADGRFCVEETGSVKAIHHLGF